MALPPPPPTACGAASVVTSVPFTGNRSRDEVAALVFKSLRSCTQTQHAVAFIERLRLSNRLSFADMWGRGTGEDVEGVLAFTWRQVDAAHARGPLLPFLCSRMPRAIVMHWRLLCSALPQISSNHSSIRWILDVQLRDVICAHYRHAARTMMPFAPGAAALRESVHVVKELIADSEGNLGDTAFATSVVEDLIDLVRAAPQTAEVSVDAAAASAAEVSHNLKSLAKLVLPEQPLTCAQAEYYISMLQVFSKSFVYFGFLFMHVYAYSRAQVLFYFFDGLMLAQMLNL